MVVDDGESKICVKLGKIGRVGVIEHPSSSISKFDDQVAEYVSSDGRTGWGF